MNLLVRNGVIEEREFQTNIAEKAVRENTLVVLPTATGKTIIAALVASHFLYNHGDKKVLMMAPTKPLVQQHRDTFLRVLKLRPEDVQVMTGEQDPDYRLHLWEGDARIYFATPQVVRNDCELGLSLGDFTLLIFDECHRAKKKYAYTEVADTYIEDSPYPMILGLTASPGADEETIQAVCNSLHAEHIEARTKDDPDIEPYVNEIEVKRRFVELPESHESVKEKLEGMLNWRLDRLRDAGVIEKDPEYTYKGDLIEAGSDIRYRMQLTQLDVEAAPLRKHLVTWSSALTVWHALDLLESQGPYALRRFLDRIGGKNKKSYNFVTSEMRKRGVLDELESLGEHPKVEAAKGAVLDKLDEDPSARAIVFTQYRDTASHLASEFRDLGIPARRFVGQANREGDEGLSQAEQAELLGRLRSGDLKVLVATSVGEEGLDVPSVDLVVFYEPVPSGVRYIQRRGRTGRKSRGEAVILATENTHDVAYLRVSERKRKNMRSAVKRLNSELEPIERKGPRPERNPIPEEVITEAEEYSPPTREETPEAEIRLEEKIKPAEIAEERTKYLERRREREFRRRERVAAERVLEKVLASGEKGAQIEKLKKTLKEDGSTEGVAKAAIERLEAEDQVRERGGLLLSRGAARVRKTPSGGNVHEFEVEKVLRGKAIMRVDGKWRAVLPAEDYEGPRHLIKKGRKFRGLAELYHEDGSFHAWIKDVVGR